jgi:hypothetical protein
VVAYSLSFSTPGGSSESVVAVSRLDGPRDPVLTVVTGIVGVIVALTFVFGFGNVLALAIRLGVPLWVAPLVAPAVDLSVVGLLLSIRYLSIRGAEAEAVRPARRLLLASSVVTLALNVAEPLLAGDFGRALFDVVGPLLLIGWAEVGPALLHELAAAPIPSRSVGSSSASEEPTEQATPGSQEALVIDSEGFDGVDDELLDRARRADRRHRELHQRPISAENLRQDLGVGARRSRLLVKIVREEWTTSTSASVLSLPNWTSIGRFKRTRSDVTPSVSGMINRFTDQQFRVFTPVSGFCSSSFRRVPTRCFAFPSPEYRLLILMDRAEELISVVAENPGIAVAALAVSSTGRDPVAVVVTVVMGVVVGLTFLFGFGNVLSLALKLGVPAYVAPLVAPAVDLTVLVLLMGLGIWRFTAHPRTC